MAKKIKGPFTNLQIRSMNSHGADEWTTDSPGLILHITPAGTKTFFAYYELKGRKSKLAIGRFPEINIDEARRRRDLVLKQVETGVDPVRFRLFIDLPDIRRSRAEYTGENCGARVGEPEQLEFKPQPPKPEQGTKAKDTVMRSGQLGETLRNMLEQSGLDPFEASLFEVKGCPEARPRASKWSMLAESFLNPMAWALIGSAVTFAVLKFAF